MTTASPATCGCHRDSTGSPTSGPGRRGVLLAAGSAAVVVATVAACGSSGGTPANAGEGPGPAAGTVLVAAGDVPVGGGVVVPAQKVVVTQPSAGEYRGYSVVCPHQGCAVTTVRDGYIICPCHGSRFAVATGEPVKGSPAKTGLTPWSVADVDGQITAK